MARYPLIWLIWRRAGVKNGGLLSWFSLWLGFVQYPTLWASILYFYLIIKRVDSCRVFPSIIIDGSVIFIGTLSCAGDDSLVTVNSTVCSCWLTTSVPCEPTKSLRIIVWLWNQCKFSTDHSMLRYRCWSCHIQALKLGHITLSFSHVSHAFKWHKVLFFQASFFHKKVA